MKWNCNICSIKITTNRSIVIDFSTDMSEFNYYNVEIRQTKISPHNVFFIYNFKYWNLFWNTGNQLAVVLYKFYQSLYTRGHDSFSE
jgi:hypothetical protein